MTKLLDTAIAKLRALPADQQDEAAEIVLSLLSQGADTLHLSAIQIAEIERRLVETSPQFASHAEVLAFFQRPAE